MEHIHPSVPSLPAPIQTLILRLQYTRRKLPIILSIIDLLIATESIIQYELSFNKTINYLAIDNLILFYQNIKDTEIQVTDPVVMHSSRFLSHKNKDLVEAVAIFFGLSSNRFAHSLIEEHIFRNAMHKAVLERVVEDLFVGFFQQ